MGITFNPFTGTLDFTGTGGGGGGTPAAPDTSVQFNNAGSFGGDGNFTFVPNTAFNVSAGAALGLVPDLAVLESKAAAIGTSKLTLTSGAGATPGNIQVDGSLDLIHAGVSDTEVLFMDGTRVSGNANLTWDKTTNTLTLVDIPITAGAGQVASSALVIGSDPNDIFEITSAPTNGNVFVISGGGAATQVGNYFATEVDIQGGADTGTGAGGLVIVGAGHQLTGNPVGGRVSIESGFGSPNGEITFKPGGSDAWTIDGTSGDLSGASGKNLATAAGYYQGSEMTAPSAGAANTFRLFAQDNGGGKTQLMILFATGAAQQLAVQA